MHCKLFSLQRASEIIVSALAQGRKPESILRIMKIADRVNMPKTLACCERHVAIMVGAKRMRKEAFWAEIPASSSERIAMGLHAVHANFRDQALSKIGPLLDDLRRYGFYTGDYESEADDDVVRVCREEVLDVLCEIKLKDSVPPCKAFLEMAQPVLSKTDSSDAELYMSDSSEA